MALARRSRERGVDYWPGFVDAQHPGDVLRDLPVELDQRGCELVELGAPAGLHHGRARIEEHLGLKHEAVADDPDVGPIAQNRAQPAEEFRAEARQFLHALRQREIEPLAEIGDASL